MIVLLGAGIALRAALRLSPPGFDDAELVTPLTSARSVLEGCSFLRRGLEPYGTPPSACRHAPILLHALCAFEPALFAICVAANGAVAFLLHRLGRASSRRAATRAPHAAAVAFVCAPWTAAACAALGTSALQHAPLLGALLLAHRGRLAGASAALAAAALVLPDAVWLVPATASLWRSSAARRRSPPGGARAEPSLGAFAAAFALWLALFAGLARWAAGSWAFADAVHGAWARGDGQRPGVGLWWYLLAQVFPASRAHFVFALHVLPRLCLLPLAARLRRWPLLCAALSFGVITAFKPHLAMPDVVLALALLGTQLDASLLGHARPSLLAAGAALLVGALACRPLLRGWLGARALNANFAFAASLLLGVAQSEALLALTAAALRRDWAVVSATGATRIQRAWRRRRRKRK